MPRMSKRKLKSKEQQETVQDNRDTKKGNKNVTKVVAKKGYV